MLVSRGRWGKMDHHFFQLNYAARTPCCIQTFNIGLCSPCKMLLAEPFLTVATFMEFLQKAYFCFEAGGPFCPTWMGKSYYLGFLVKNCLKTVKLFASSFRM